LEVALKEHVEQEAVLHAETSHLEQKLTQATETFREKLHKCDVFAREILERLTAVNAFKGTFQTSQSCLKQLRAQAAANLKS
jgi:hypothetical protein